MKRFLLLLFAFIPLFFSPSVSFAQLDDVFEAILKEVSGVNVSIRRDSRPRDLKDEVWWLDASLKYGPFGFGEGGLTTVVQTHTAELGSFIPPNGKDAVYFIVIDTLIVKGNTPTKKCRDTLWFKDRHCRDSTYQCIPAYSSNTCFVREDPEQLTLAFGLTHTPLLDMSNGSLRLKSNATAIYIRAIGKLASVDLGSVDVGANIGFGLSYLTLGEAEAYITQEDNNILGIGRMVSETTFSPQAFAGLYASYNGITIFADIGYEYTEFSNLKFDDVEDELSVADYRKALPRQKNLSSMFLRAGLSFSIK